MNWQSDCESFLREIVPEDLAGVPVYIEPDTVGELCDSTLAMCKHDSDGFHMVIRIELVKSVQELIGVVLHEFAHFLDDRPKRRARQPRKPTARQKEIQLARLSLIHDWTNRRLVPRWLGHEERFVRACCHLWHRANQRMASLRPKHLTYGERYYPVHFNENAWIQSLSDELGYSGSIRRLLDSKPPEAFTKLHAMATK